MTTRSKVEKLLQDNPKLRDSDVYLLFNYWQDEGLVLTDQQKMQLSQLTTAESITRVRRDLRDKYPGSPEVEGERFKKYIEMRDEYGERYMKEIFE